MLTVMYFGAMTFLKREQRSWGGDDTRSEIRRVLR